MTRDKFECECTLEVMMVKSQEMLIVGFSLTIIHVLASRPSLVDSLLDKLSYYSYRYT